MVDNTELNPGSGGDVIASDEIAGVKFPRSKMVIGADGVNDGDVSKTNPLPVTQGTISHAAPTFATVGVASGLILAANASRKYASIVNDSTSIIYLAFGAPAVVGSGTRLDDGGGSYEMNSSNMSTQAINGIAATAGNNVTVQEAT